MVRRRAPRLRPAALLLPIFALLRGRPAAGDSNFGRPNVRSASSTCATVEFPWNGGPLDKVYVFAKRPDDLEFVQWGAPLPTRNLGTDQYTGVSSYRFLMRDLPAGENFQVRISDTPSLLSGDVSEASETSTLLTTSTAPAAPSDLQIHRTDLRLNKQQHDDSVCVDLHWSHPHPQLHQEPDDVYFRIRWNTMAEEAKQFCQDKVGEISRSCGTPLGSVTSRLPSAYTSICGLRPNRTVRFEVEAFTCDMASAASHFQAVTPTTAPNVVMTSVTSPPNQESFAGFRPLAVLSWVPEDNPLIEGHAVYLALRDLAAIRLLCWVPKGSGGHLEVPIARKNHTYSEDTLLLRDYWNKQQVHQEEELIVATRSAVVVGGVKQSYHIESPASSHRLGSWLVLTEAVKCLTSFEAKYPEYVTHPVVPAWTQEEALTMYD